ncbi:MAG: OmpH family outer membrane protein [bacterium]|nr:OmpH family outer membrane protein [bacterium]
MKTGIENKPFLSLLIIGLLVALGIATGMIIAPVKAQSTFATIGFVDVQKALAAHPDFQPVMTQIQAFEDAKIAELSSYENVDTMTDEQRQQLMTDVNRIQDEVSAERQRLTAPLIQDIVDATTSVGEESGIEVILEAGSVMWGGLDLTPLIITRITGN